VLAPGQKVTLRIIRVFPVGGLSPGERLLNGHPPIQPGDRFLAEVLQPPGAPPDLVGGVVTKIVCPGCFGRPGYVVLQMGQLVADAAGMAQPGPWQVDLQDRRFGAQMQRAVVTTLFAVEGAAAGAAIGAQRAAGNMAWISGGTGIGLLLGVAYASLQRGTEPDLQPGDTFQVVVGTTCYRPIPREWQTILYPAPNPFCRKVKHP
jgi:hypothetical protein